MTEQWKTKYGSRRVRHDPPTLEEAIFAAQGITDELDGQVDIAASLMGVPAEKVREQIIKMRPGPARTTRVISVERGSQNTIVVERRSRRPLASRRVTLDTTAR